MTDGTPTTPTQLLPRRTSVQHINYSRTAHRSRTQGHALSSSRCQDKTARGHAGTEASSRSARRIPIDPYSDAYTCTLGLYLEL